MRICFLARSESARSSSSSPPQIPLKVAGNRLRLKVPKAFETFRLQPVIPSRTSLRDSLTHADLFPRALGIFTLQPVIPSRTILNDSLRSPSACGFVSSRARNPHAPPQLIYTSQAPAAPRQSWRIHRATPQYCRGAPSPGKENHRHHQKEQRLRRHPQQESPENHNLPPSAQW